MGGTESIEENPRRFQTREIATFSPLRCQTDTVPEEIQREDAHSLTIQPEEPFSSIATVRSLLDNTSATQKEENIEILRQNRAIPNFFFSLFVSQGKLKEEGRDDFVQNFLEFFQETDFDEILSTFDSFLPGDLQTLENILNTPGILEDFECQCIEDTGNDEF